MFNYVKAPQFNVDTAITIQSRSSDFHSYGVYDGSLDSLTSSLMRHNCFSLFCGEELESVHFDRDLGKFIFRNKPVNIALNGGWIDVAILERVYKRYSEQD